MGAEVSEVPATSEEEGELLRVVLGLAVRCGADERAGVVVVVFGELARLPAVEAAGGRAQRKG